MEEAFEVNSKSAEINVANINTTMAGVPGKVISDMTGVTEMSEVGNSETNYNGINMSNSDS